MIILGNTGSGKSTLGNYIAGIPLIAKKKKYGKYYFIDVLDNDLKAFEIGHGTESQTTLPNKWVDSNGITYWDCPGFVDTKGFEQNIINAFYIKWIFDSSKEVKIVIVVPESDILIQKAKT